MSEQIVMRDSPEAAQYRTDLKGWVSRDGFYFGDGPQGERTARYIFRRHSSGVWIGYQDKIQQGLLEMKTDTVERSDGTKKTVESVLVTPKGLAKLAVLIGGKEAA